jgi:hypothetical protein
VRDNRNNAAFVAGDTILLRIITFIGDGGGRPDVGSGVEGRFELCAVADFAAGQMERDRQPVEVGLEVDLGRESTPGAAERLILLPPFAPNVET